jgi:BirA family biotin operon repressor/biotin-[acetyl-CoA-carboxylase] ligase
MIELDPRASAAGVRLLSHEVLPSTNTEALALGRRGERGPLWVVAARQTAGRGRRGRSWISDAGNLFATLLLTDPAPPEHWPEWAFVAALAIHDAIAEVAPAIKPSLAIKWPNDLLLAGAKFAGLLIEGEPAAGGRGAVAVGIGVNCASHPADTDFPATDLASAGAAVSPESLFAPLSAKMIGRLAQWNSGEHFSTIRADWLARAAGLGETMRVRVADKDIVGSFETIDDTGRLVLVAADGARETIAAGDVVTLDAAGLSSSRAPSGQS